jgi:hypothetical protein
MLIQSFKFTNPAAYVGLLLASANSGEGRYPSLCGSTKAVREALNPTGELAGGFGVGFVAVVLAGGNSLWSIDGVFAT